MKRILVIEDNLEINNLVRDFLVIKNYTVEQTMDGKSALKLIDTNTYDCLVLDLMLPFVSGETLIDLIRNKSEVPILVISAKDDEKVKIDMLKLGVNDFLLKPFNLEELYLKIEKNTDMFLRLNNQHQFQNDIIVYKNIKVNQQNREVSVENEIIHLTLKEYDLLVYFIKRPNAVFTKETLFKEIWSEEYCLDTNTVAVHVSNLRKKLDRKGKEFVQIETVWGIGFKLS